MPAANSLPTSNGPKVRGRPFHKGQSGNPSGRRRGTVSPLAALRRALTRREADELARAVLALAKKGDPTCLRLVFEKLDATPMPSNQPPAVNVEFVIPDNGRDARPVQQMSDAELDGILQRAVAMGVPGLMAAGRLGRDGEGGATPPDGG